MSIDNNRQPFRRVLLRLDASVYVFLKVVKLLMAFTLSHIHNYFHTCIVYGKSTPTYYESTMSVCPVFCN